MRREDQSSERLHRGGREQRVVPYGGDRAVARSMVAVHVRNPWTGRCRACRERYPCPDRLDAEAVLGPQVRPQRSVALFVVFGVIAVVTGALAALAVAQW